jgi:hypothetical protein
VKISVAVAREKIDCMYTFYIKSLRSSKDLSPLWVRLLLASIQNVLIVEEKSLRDS